MWPDMTRRSTARELMDDRSIGGDELAVALGQLRVINSWLGSGWPTLEGVSSFWRKAGRPARLTILDVGAGSGDVNRLLLAWAIRRNIALHITLVDMHPETCASAAAYYRDDPRVQVVCSDLLHLGMQPADIVTATLFTHHFPSEQLAEVLATLSHMARIGVVINDLHRHPVAWAGIWVATRLFSRNRMIRHDAPLSVQRGFRLSDLDQLRSAPALGILSYVWRPFFRYLITIPSKTFSIEANMASDNA